jgi:V8-like Glu-specific endopeptidase
MDKCMCGVTVGLLAVALFSLNVQATEDYGQPVMPRGEFVAYTLDTGAIDNAADAEAVVFTHNVHQPEAAWMRVFFSEADLPAGSRVRMTSLLDGEVQDLNASDLSMWENASAFFNGDTVRVELIAAPQAKGCRLQMQRIMAELAPPEGAPGQCGICSADDRVPSNVDWSCRIMPVGCSGTVYSRCSCVISAGHCNVANMVLQFRVPNSTAACGLTNPPVAEQFPVTGVQANNGGVGNDWMVMASGTNNLGEQAFQRYGQRRRVSVAVPSTGSFFINGYGIDQTCILTQTQQLSAGNVTSVTANTLLHGADIRGGNSGSGGLRDNIAIGVITHCVSGPSACTGNVAQRVNIAAFVNARNTLCPCSECIGDIAGPGGNGAVDIQDLLLVIASWGATGIDEADVNLDNVVNITDLLAVIAVWGPCP